MCLVRWWWVSTAIYLKHDMEARAEALAGSVGAIVVDQYANMVLLSADATADVVSLSEQLSRARRM